MATWNVGGNPPHGGLNLDDFLCVDDESDIYVLGYVSYSLGIDCYILCIINALSSWIYNLLRSGFNFCSLLMLILLQF